MDLNKLFGNTEEDSNNQNEEQVITEIEDVTKSNEKIETKGDNKGNLTTSNGKIVVNGNNNGNCITSNGKVVINKDNFGLIRTSNGKIEIYGENNSDIATSNGRIIIEGDNNGSVQTTNGKIFIGGKNNGNLTFSNGGLELIGNDLKISIVGNKSNIIIGDGNIVMGNSFIGNKNSKIIINGVDISELINEGNGGEKKFKIEINSFEIDFYKDKILEKSSGQELDILDEKNDSIYRDGDKIVCFLNGQKIVISEENIKVEKMN